MELEPRACRALGLALCALAVAVAAIGRADATPSGDPHASVVVHAMDLVLGGLGAGADHE